MLSRAHLDIRFDSDSELMAEFSKLWLYILAFIFNLLSIEPNRWIEHHTVSMAFGGSPSIAADSHLNAAENSFIFKYPTADILDARVESIGDVNKIEHVWIVKASQPSLKHRCLNTTLDFDYAAVLHFQPHRFAQNIDFVRWPDASVEYHRAIG